MRHEERRLAMAPPTIVLIAGAYALASAACVAVALRGRRRATHALGLVLLALVVLPAVAVAAQDGSDLVRIGELAAVTLALAAPSLGAILVLERRGWRRALVLAIGVAALPLLVQGLLYFTADLASGWPLASALAVHVVGVVALALRAMAPERSRRARPKLAEPVDARAHP